MSYLKINHPRINYRIAGWHGIAGEIATPEEWSLWAQDELIPSPVLAEPEPGIIPQSIRRRLGTLGRCVMSAFVRCMPFIDTEPAVIAVSRHGDLVLLDKLITSVRADQKISPTVFTHSVHNRLASTISIFAGYRGVNGAYSSVRDGFQLALFEAASLIAEGSVSQALIVAYEPPIPEHYHAVINAPWKPHVALFVLEKADPSKSGFSLLQHPSSVGDVPDSGTCLPLIRTIAQKKSHRDGFWEHQYYE